MNLWYNQDVPVKPEKKGEPLPMKVQASTLKAIAAIAKYEDRPVGYVARELMLRGLSLYQIDGKLRDSQQEPKSKPLGKKMGEIADLSKVGLK